MVWNTDHQVQIKTHLSLQYTLIFCKNPQEGLALLNQNPSDYPVVLLQFDIPNFDSLDLLKSILTSNPRCEVICLTAEQNMQDSVEAIRYGAFHYLCNPLSLETLEILIARALFKQDMIQKIKQISVKNFLNAFDTERGLLLAQELVSKRRKEGKAISPNELIALLPKPKNISPSYLDEFMTQLNDIHQDVQHEWNTIRVLVVEDDPFVGPGLLNTLTDENYTVTLACTRKEALELASRPKSIDVILLDVFLPDGLGSELMIDLKALHPEAEIIVITAYEISEIAVDVLKKGAWTFLNKPFLKMDLMAALASAIQASTLKKVLNELELNIIHEVLPLGARVAMFKELFAKRAKLEEPVLFEDLLIFVPELEAKIGDRTQIMDITTDVDTLIYELIKK